MPPARPIGFWLKLLDQLINSEFDAVLETHGVTRRQWQVLTLLSTGEASQHDLADALAPFVASDQPESLGEELAELVGSDWLIQTGEVFTLTARGRTSWTRLGEVVGRSREVLARGISAEEYAQTLDVLERMARNLGWSDPQPSPAASSG